MSLNCYWPHQFESQSDSERRLHLIRFVRNSEHGQNTWMTSIAFCAPNKYKWAFGKVFPFYIMHERWAGLRKNNCTGERIRIVFVNTILFVCCSYKYPSYTYTRIWYRCTALILVDCTYTFLPREYRRTKCILTFRIFLHICALCTAQNWMFTLSLPSSVSEGQATESWIILPGSGARERIFTCYTRIEGEAGAFNELVAIQTSSIPAVVE